MARRWISLLVVGLMLVPLIGCSGGGTRQASNGGGYGGASSSYAPAPPPRKPGMSTRNKLILLAGAAALAYLYNKHKNRTGAGPEGQYYRSKNGRIYYRDAQHNVHWVTPPSGGIQVPADDPDLPSRSTYSY